LLGSWEAQNMGKANRRISNNEYRIPKGEIASLTLFCVLKVLTGVDFDIQDSKLTDSL
jgi:hypothetical protein